MAQYRAIRAQALAAKGTVDGDFAERMNDGAEKARAFTIQMENLGIKVGSITGPMIDRAKIKIGGLADWMSQLSDTSPALFAGLVTVGGGMAGVLAVVGPLALAVGLMLPGLTMMRNGLGGMFGAAKRLGPVLRFAGMAVRWLAVGFGRIAWMVIVNGFRLLTFASKGLAIGLRFTGIALRFLVSGLARLALAVVTNPVLLLAAGIAVGAYLIYKNWDTIQGYLSSALVWFQGIWTRFKAFASLGIAGIGAAILNFSPLGLFYSAFAGVMGWFGVSLPNTFAGFGGMIIGGLWRGITSRLAALKSGIIGIAASAAGWFKKAMGIKSPSRVFMGFGGYMTEGLAIGVDRGASRPLDRVRRMAADIAAAGAPPRMLRNAVTIAGAVSAGAGIPAIAAPTSAPIGVSAPSAAIAPVIHHHTHHNKYDITIAGNGDVRSQARQLLAEIRRLEATERASSYQDD